MTPQEQPDSHKHVYRKHAPTNTMYCVICRQPEPDSQAGDEQTLDEIFADFYSYDTDEEHISMPVGRAKAAVRNYAERLATKRAIEELEYVQANHPIVSVFHADCKICSWIDERIATITKEKQ